MGNPGDFMKMYNFPPFLVLSELFCIIERFCLSFHPHPHFKPIIMQLHYNKFNCMLWSTLPNILSSLCFQCLYHTVYKYI